MNHLEECFKMAIESGERFVAVAIQMEGFNDVEFIINPIENAEAKLEYYKKTYDNELNHKFSNGIKIVGATFGNTFEEIAFNFYV
jgi:MoaA/NifB/PqqE/SkfB family radical SAM enzyme